MVSFLFMVYMRSQKVEIRGVGAEENIMLKVTTTREDVQWRSIELRSLYLFQHALLQDPQTLLIFS